MSTVTAGNQGGHMSNACSGAHAGHVNRHPAQAWCPAQALYGVPLIWHGGFSPLINRLGAQLAMSAARLQPCLRSVCGCG